jgi:hypothetical protein
MRVNYLFRKTAESVESRVTGAANGTRDHANGQYRRPTGEKRTTRQRRENARNETTEGEWTTRIADTRDERQGNEAGEKRGWSAG